MDLFPKMLFLVAFCRSVILAMCYPLGDPWTSLTPAAAATSHQTPLGCSLGRCKVFLVGSPLLWGQGEPEELHFRSASP